MYRGKITKVVLLSKKFCILWYRHTKTCRESNRTIALVLFLVQILPTQWTISFHFCDQIMKKKKNSESVCPRGTGHHTIPYNPPFFEGLLAAKQKPPKKIQNSVEELHISASLAMPLATLGGNGEHCCRQGDVEYSA